MRRVLALAVAVAMAASVAVGSVLPWSAHPTEKARIRLAWSARPERIERCRRLTDEELAGVPAHMRERIRCEGSAARYLLRVITNEQARMADTVRGGGARHEGMIHLLRDVSLPPGQVRLAISVIRIDSVDSSTDSLGAVGSERERRMEETRERVRREALPPTTHLDTTITLTPREILLVGYDAGTRRLQLVRGGGGGS